MSNKKYVATLLYCIEYQRVARESVKASHFISEFINAYEK